MYIYDSLFFVIPKYIRFYLLSLDYISISIFIDHIQIIGMTGFEPATSCSQSIRATKLRYIPFIFKNILSKTVKFCKFYYPLFVRH